MKDENPRTLFEKSELDQRAYSLPYKSQVFDKFLPPKHLLRNESILLPEVSELNLMRHFCFLAQRNVGIDTTFYPLGSCTMKYNPRVNEQAARLPQFANSHPLAPEESVKGSLEIIEKLTAILCNLTGMKGGSLVPNAGAQGEFTGIRMIAKYHELRGDSQRKELIIPDNAHGTNPATAAMCGYKTISVKTNAEGDIDVAELRKLLSEKTAGLMLTNPNTLGLFGQTILEVATLVHEAGGLLYYDGANLNPLLGIARPGDMGFDVMHINLHKTFSTPHGGGGPGSGAVFAVDTLIDYLPLPHVFNGKVIWDSEKSIGHMATFHGNFSVCLRAYLYAIMNGNYGLRRVAEVSVINANYLKKGLECLFTIPFPRSCMHEFVVQADNYLYLGIRALDIAKRLLDFGVHAPTIYFPLIVKECLLIEPTETESKETLDRFIEIMHQIVKEIVENPELVKNAPYTLPVTRLDEVLAAKNPILKHQGT